jgi:hypothetical protein
LISAQVPEIVQQTLCVNDLYAAKSIPVGAFFFKNDFLDA